MLEVVAMSAIQRPRLTLPDYDARERRNDFRSEFYNGQMFAMAGGSAVHSLIKTNAARELSSALKGKPCTAYDSDLRILIEATGLYTYPDLSIICGEIQFDGKLSNTAVNPTLLLEVLSESTEAYDRGKKFDHCRQIPTLREYVLVAQDRPHLERFQRNADDTWTLTVVSGLDRSITFPSVGVIVALAEIYHKVQFPAQDDHAPGQVHDAESA
jgi:Uma2 family endonuclease